MSVARFLTGLIVAGSATGLALGFSQLPPETNVGSAHFESMLGVGAAAIFEATPGVPSVQSYDDLNAPYDGLYHFVRILYSSNRGGGYGRRRGGGAMWAHDYPRAERNFLSIMAETTFVGSQTEGSNVLTFDDPELFKYPISYIVEVGDWNPTEEEVEALGDYLHKGGFLIVDDFRGSYALDNLEFHLRRALPELNMVMIDETNDIFDSFFRVVPQDVIPPYGGGAPIWYGVYEDNDPAKRLMVIINFNNDIAEYWEFSDLGYYPIDLANEAYKLGVNYVVYGLTH